MPIVASYVVGSGGFNADTLTTPAFTPTPGEVIVVKLGNQDDDDPTCTGVTGGGLAWRNTAEWRQGTGNFTDAWIYTATVGDNPTQMAVSSTWTAAVQGTGYHGMIVERWSRVILPATPAVNGIRTGTGAPLSTINEIGYASSLTWVCVDWNATTGPSAARGADGQLVAEYSPGSGGYYAPTVAARATGAQTLDSTTHPITLPTGTTPGDMLVVHFSSDGASPVSLPDGSEWTMQGTAVEGTAASSTLIWKIADGTDALTVLTGAPEQSTHVCLRIPNGTTLQAASAHGNGGTPGGTTTTTATTATITGRTVGGNDTAAASHTVGLPAGVTAGEAALVLFGNDFASVTASTTAAGWQQLDSQGQGGTGNHRGTVFYAPDAATAAPLVVNLVESSTGLAKNEEAAWASFRIAGGGTPVLAAIPGGGSTAGNTPPYSFTAQPLTGLAQNNYTALLLVAVDSSTDTTLSQTMTWPAGWVNPQVRRPTVAATSAGPSVHTAEQRYTAVTSITPGTITKSIGEQYVQWTVAIPDTTTTTTTPDIPAWNVPPALTLGGAGVITERTPTLLEYAAATSVTPDTSTAQVGDLMVVTCAAAGGALSISSGWTELIAPQTVAGGGFGVWWRFRNNTAADNPTVTQASTTAGRFSAICQPLAGVDPTTPLVGAATLTNVGGGVTFVSVPAVSYLAGSVSLTGAVIDGTGETYRLTQPPGYAVDRQTSGVGRRIATATRAHTDAGSTGALTWTQAAGPSSMAGYAVVFRPAAVAATNVARLWLSTLTLDTSAALGASQALTVPPGFGQLTRSNGATTATALSATAETTSTATSMQPAPWVNTTAEDWACWTVAITGAVIGGGGAMRMWAGVNYDPDAAPGIHTIGMTAPTGQAWTLVGIELFAAPVTVALGVAEEIQEVPDLTAGRAFNLGTAETVEEVPALTATRIVAGPYLDVVDEIEELPPLAVSRELAPLDVAETVEDPPPVGVHHLVALDVPETVEEAPDITAGSTALGVAITVEEVPPLLIGHGGIDIARSPSRRGVPPVIQRGGVRVMAQRIITGEWLHLGLPVEGLQLTRTLSGPQVITGKFSHEIVDLRDVNLEPWGTWVHVEEAGEIRASGILMPGSYGEDGALELEAVGVSAYAARIPYTGEARFIQADPAEIVRTLWQHVQSFERGDLGVTVEGSTPVRLGTAETPEVRDDTVEEQKAAAQYIIDALGNPAVTVYSDWSWASAPDVVLRWNDTLVGQFRAANPAAPTAPVAPVADGNITRPTYREMTFQLAGSAAWATGPGPAGGGYAWANDYGAISAVTDGRGYVAGVGAFSSASGSLLAVVQAYTAAAPGNALEPYLDELTTLASEGRGPNAAARADALLGGGFRTLWAGSGQNPQLRKAQQQERDRQLFTPAQTQAQADGVGPLGLAIHHGILMAQGAGSGVAQYGGILAAARAASAPPAKGGDHAAYLRAMLTAAGGRTAGTPGRALTAAAPPPAALAAAAQGAEAAGPSGRVRTVEAARRPPRTLDAAPAEDELRPYIVGATKIPHPRRDVAHAVITSEDPRGWRDLIDADDDPAVPHGAPVTYRVLLTREEARRFGDASNCRYIEPDGVAYPDAGAVSIPAASTLAWMRADHPRIDAFHGRDVVVGLMDGGTTAAVRDYLGVTMVARRVFGPDDPGADEVTNTHGCLVAPCLLPRGGRFLDAIVAQDSGSALVSDSIVAAKWCADQGAKIVNYSYSSLAVNTAWTDAAQYLKDRGVQFYCSAGNDGAASLGYPAQLSTTWTNVHSSISFNEQTSTRAPSSNHTADASGCAPGVYVLGMLPTAELVIWNGTSASSPHMALLNIMGCTGGRFSAAQVAAALRANTRNTGAAAVDQGRGAWDLTAALTALHAFDGLAPPAYRRNLDPNPSAETGIAGYALAATGVGLSAALAQSPATTGVFGTRTARVTVTKTGTPVATAPSAELALPTIAVTAGAAYVFSAHGRADAELGDVQWWVQWQNAAGGNIGSPVIGDRLPLMGSVLSRYTLAATAPPGAAQAVRRLRGWAMDNSDNLPTVWDTDAVHTEQAPTLGTYFDGATVGAVWEGAAHASPSSVGNPAIGVLGGLVDTNNTALTTPFSWTVRGAAFSLAAPPADPDAAPAPTTDRDLAITWLREQVLTRTEVTAEAGKPWELHGYELAMVGRVIEDLAEEAPFEYVEEQGWADAQRTRVWHRIRIGYPRIGARRDLNLTQGENILEHAPFEEPTDTYADSAFVTGKGEGEDAVTGYAGVSVPVRLRLPKVITDKTIPTKTLATARAHEEIAIALASVEEIAEIAVDIRHPNSEFGTFDVGDEVLPRVRLPWLGTFAQWHRITQLTYAPDEGYATCRLSRRDAFRSR